MKKIRVLVVDDAVVMRRLLSEVVQRDPLLELAGTSPNGRIALQKLNQINPDVITLDVEMPELDGLATLREIRRTHPRLPVIMLSLVTQRGAAATLEALTAGASDYVTKPAESGNLAESIARLEADLLPKIHAHCRRAEPMSGPAATASSGRGGVRPVELICVGISTGGPNALADLFRQLQTPLPVPMVIVQHMPPMFTRLLAERLDGIRGAFRCREVADGEKLETGWAYVAPGGRHLSVSRAAAGHFVACLGDGPPENSCRPAVDVLFRTAAATGAGLLGVVMTGMGQDGLRGCREIAARSGQILVQDERSSVVWGMPGAVAQAGLAHAILPLEQLGAEITRRVLPAAGKSTPR